MLNIFKVVFVMVMLCIIGCKPNNPIEQPKAKQEISKKVPENLMALYQVVEPVALQGNDLEAQLNYTEALRRQSIEAMKLFDDLPEAKKQTETFEKNSFVSLPLGPQITQVIFKGKNDPRNDPRSFEVVYMPLEYYKLYGSLVIVNQRTMRIFANFRVKEWLGIILHHEMIHIEDVLNQVKDNRYRREVRPHLLENDLIKSWNPKGFNEMIKRSKTYLTKVQRKPYEVTREDMYQIAKIASNYYPITDAHTSRAESGLATAACIVAVLFELSKEKDAESLSLVYQRVIETK